MTNKSGYFWKILNIDATTGKAIAKPIDEAFAEKYIGGRGFNAKFVYDNLKKHGKINPLGPENLIAISPGPLCGLYIPSSGKTSLAAISPATGTYGDSSVGGSFGVELRQAGYDALTITGRAPELSYLWIDNDQVSLIPFPKIKGKTALETERMVKEHIGDHSVSLAVIGPAGENLVKFACINCDWGRNAGRTGMGAILGSKNIKAIAVRGSCDLPVFDLKRLVEVSQKAYDYLRNQDMFTFWQHVGLMSVIDYANTHGFLPTNNFRDGTFDKANKINADEMIAQGHKINNTACFACPMSCGNVCVVKNGKYAGAAVEGPEYETAAMFGSNLGIDDFSAVIKANQLCDELGLDTISSGNLIGVVMEGYQTGLLTLKDLENKPIEWGNSEAVFDLLHKISSREGIGDVMAEGALGLIKKYPKLERIISHVKGLEQSAYDGRGALSMALSYGTSDIGAHHTRAWTIGRELEEGENWTHEQQAELVIYHQTLRPLFDMLGVCRLPWIELGLDEHCYAEMYSAVTGKKATLDDLLERSKHIYNLTRTIGIEHGLTSKDDLMPPRMTKDPVQSGKLAGRKIDPTEYKKLLDIYYQKRGWDKNGVPPKEKY